MQKKWPGPQGWVFSVNYIFGGDKDYFSVPVGFKIGEGQTEAISEVVNRIDAAARRARVPGFLFIDAASDISENFCQLFSMKGYEPRFHGRQAYRDPMLSVSPLR